MSTNQTASYQLHLWAPGDDFLREEFNENFEALDDAARVVYGVYIGDGTNGRAILLGFAPKAVLVERASGVRDQYVQAGGLAMPGQHSLGGSVTVTNQGFSAPTPKKTQNNFFYFLALCKQFITPPPRIIPRAASLFVPCACWYRY